MSLYQFALSRIAMGRMDPVAVSRINRIIRQLPCEDGLRLCRPKYEQASLRSGKLKAREVHFRDAARLVNSLHRHHSSPVGHLFSGAVFDGQIMCAAVIAGRPVSRVLDDEQTIELTRVVTDGTRNAASKVMGWAIAEARKRGYSRIITYTLESESGASLRAVGFTPTAISRGGSWNTPSRKRQPDRHPTGPKLRWEINFQPTKREESKSCAI
jgi:hypothetical protein